MSALTKLPLIALLVASSSLASDSGSVNIAKELVGSWEIDSNNASEIERFAMSRGAYYLTTYYRGGSGITVRYEGRLCAKPVSKHDFVWKVSDRVLVTTRVNDGVWRDRVMFINSQRMVLYSIDYKLLEYRRRRFTRCA